MATKKDYYEILGVPKSSTDAEVKSAYRKLARQYHPDVNKTAEAAVRFKEVSEAYQVLSDSQKRKTYDQFGHAAFEPGMGGFGGAGANGPFGGFSYDFSSKGRSSAGGDFGGFSDPFDLFEQIFGMGGFGGQGFGNYKRRPTYQMEISFEEAVRGATKEVEIEDSSGKSKKVTLKIPAGVDNGTRMRFEEIDIVFRVTRHPEFLREGSDIFSEIDLSIPRLVLGDVVEVNTIWGKVNLKVASGTEPGVLIKIKEQGMPRLQGSGKGDHYVRVKLDMPKKLSDEEKKLYEELAKFGKKKKSWL